MSQNICRLCKFIDITSTVVEVIHIADRTLSQNVYRISAMAVGLKMLKGTVCTRLYMCI